MLLTDYLDRKNRVTLLQTSIADLHNSCLLTGSQDAAVLQDLAVKCDNARQQLVKTVAPWHAQAIASQKLTFDRARELYVAAFGDPNSPEYQASQAELRRIWFGDAKGT